MGRKELISHCHAKAEKDGSLIDMPENLEQTAGTRKKHKFSTEERDAIVKAYFEVSDKVSLTKFAASKNIGTSTLRSWVNVTNRRNVSLPSRSQVGSTTKSVQRR